jgi:uncharacterized protein YecE (DUF72 family)
LTLPNKRAYNNGEEKANMANRAPTHKIRVGPAGWSYTDWEGVVYPHHKPRDFHAAAYLAKFFDTIEINTTFYHPPNPRMTREWAQRIAFNPEFKFTAKLWQRFTHERSADRKDEKTFKASMAPLMEANRLGALLLQFPWSFKNEKENREYLGGLVVQFMEYPLVVEIRHNSWNRPEIFQMLVDLGVGFCNIDQPVIGRSLGATEQATAPVGYIRLHGRNYEQWFSSGDHPEERYNYYYSLQDLEPWVERIQSVAQRTDATYVVTNNHFRGKAVSNGLQLVRMLSKAPVRVPESLLAHYPELEQIRDPETAMAHSGETGMLFS